MVKDFLKEYDDEQFENMKNEILRLGLEEEYYYEILK